MNDVQSRFVLALVAFALLSSYALPKMGQAKQNGATAVSQLGQVYIGPTRGDANAPRGNVSVDELRNYAAKRAAEERKAAGLR